MKPKARNRSRGWDLRTQGWDSSQSLGSRRIGEGGKNTAGAATDGGRGLDSTIGGEEDPASEKGKKRSLDRAGTDPRP